VAANDAAMRGRHVVPRELLERASEELDGEMAGIGDVSREAAVCYAFHRHILGAMRRTVESG
jgi:hypothetical protein